MKFHAPQMQLLLSCLGPSTKLNAKAGEGQGLRQLMMGLVLRVRVRVCGTQLMMGFILRFILVQNKHWARAAIPCACATLPHSSALCWSYPEQCILLRQHQSRFHMTLPVRTFPARILRVHMCPAWILCIQYLVPCTDLATRPLANACSGTYPLVRHWDQAVEQARGVLVAECSTLLPKYHFDPEWKQMLRI